MTIQIRPFYQPTARTACWLRFVNITLQNRLFWNNNAMHNELMRVCRVSSSVTIRLILHANEKGMLVSGWRELNSRSVYNI